MNGWPVGKIVANGRGAWAWLTGYSGVPLLARPAFRHEMLAIATGAWAATATSMGFLLLFAKKAIEVPDIVLPVLTAGWALGSLAAGLTTSLLRKRRQANVASFFTAAAALSIGAVALLPMRPASGVPFTILALASMMLTMVAVQARSAIWRANYPASVRGNLISRTVIVGTLLIAALGPLLGKILDWRPEMYRAVFALAGVSWGAAAVWFARVRVRGEPAMLAHASRQYTSWNPLDLLNVLRRDRRYARFMGWQFLQGGASLMMMPVVPKILEESFGVNYSQGVIALVAAPLAAQVAMMALAGRLFDRTNIFHFRSVGAMFWSAGRLVLFVAVAMLSLPIVVISYVLTGCGQGFGTLSWRLGHLQFASQAETHLYMGVHMLLTGVRGLTMPFLGMWLYTSVLGSHVVWVAGILQLIAAVGFWRSGPAGAGSR